MHQAFSLEIMAALLNIGSRFCVICHILLSLNVFCMSTFIHSQPLDRVLHRNCICILGILSDSVFLQNPSTAALVNKLVIRVYSNASSGTAVL